MPRAFNQAACDTCRKRKVKCDESQPICGPCVKAGRYCSLSAPSPTRQRVRDAGSSSEPSISLTPRVAVQDPIIAWLVHHYVSEVAAWYDLGDPKHQFATVVAELALDESLLFSALIALSAMHVCQTSAKSARKTAEAYHASCVRQLIGLDDDSALLNNGVALASACLLRSYEILDEDVDPNRHLQGAYSFASREAALIQQDPDSLMAAGFWNYLREDITFSLFEGCVLKIDLGSLNVAEMVATQDPLHSMSVILGKLINASFERQIPEDVWADIRGATKLWYDALPSLRKPFSRTAEVAGIAEPLPKVWFLHDSHASAMHYFLTTMSILAVHASTSQLPFLEIPKGAAGELQSASGLGKAEVLEAYVAEICGVAFTQKIPSVLVNAFGPISYCGQYLRREESRHELVRNLVGCKRAIGWPIERLVRDLKRSWGEE